MSVEEELKKDHAEMQAAVDSKQKIIDAQVGPCPGLHFVGGGAGWVCLPIRKEDPEQGVAVASYSRASCLWG